MKNNIYVSCGKEHDKNVVYIIMDKNEGTYINDSRSIADLLSLDVNNYNERLIDKVIKRVYSEFKLDKAALRKNDLIFLVDSFNDNLYDKIIDLFKKEFAAELIALEILT